jgi:hypothetical protein
MSPLSFCLLDLKKIKHIEVCDSDLFLTLSSPHCSVSRAWLGALVSEGCRVSSVEMLL